jgi:phosphatidylserine decarboxylase
MTAATFAAAQLLRVLPRSRITRAVGRLCDARLHPVLSSAIVGLYAKAYRVDLDDAVVPEEGRYDTFDAFFTRKLRDGLRPLHPDPQAIVSPADGRIEDIGPITTGGLLKIKGRDYGVADLVGDASEVARYEGGQFVIVYLSPRDYHRVHSPVSGEIKLIRSMPGDYYPVNSIGERHIKSLFSVNRRVAIVIDTPTQGRVTVVMVSAMIVGRVSVSVIDERDVPIGAHVMDPPRPVARGEEIGIFRLGSTAVVFVEKGAAPPWTRRPGPVRFGEPLTEGELSQ